MSFCRLHGSPIRDPPQRSASGKNPLTRLSGRLTRIRFSEDYRIAEILIVPPLAGDTGRRKAVFVFLGLRFSESRINRACAESA